MPVPHPPQHAIQLAGRQQQRPQAYGRQDHHRQRRAGQRHDRLYCGGYERVIIETQAVGTSAYYDIDVWFRYAASGLWIRDANVGTQRINSTSPSAFVMCVDGACAVYVQCSNFYGSAAANVWGEGQ